MKIKKYTVLLLISTKHWKLMNNNYIKISDFILLSIYNFIYDKFYENINGLKFSSKIKTKFYINMNNTI